MYTGQKIGQKSYNKNYSYSDTIEKIKSVEKKEQKIALEKQEIGQDLDNNIEEGSEAVNQLLEKADALTFERTPLKERMGAENKKSFFSFLDCFNCFK